MPKRPIRFGEWKRLLFNAAIAQAYGVAPVQINLADPLAWDTFSRADGPLGKSESGHQWTTIGDWNVRDGAARAEPGVRRRQAWVELEAAAVSLAADIYLEQTREGAAGLAIRDDTSGTSLRFLLAANRETVTARLEIERDGGIIRRKERRLDTLHRRGFHIEMALNAREIECYVDGLARLRTMRPAIGRSLDIGFSNESGISSWFDNLDVRSGRLPYP
jgi:hypothetical protein